MRPVLHTDRLTLAPPSEDDLPHLVEMNGDAEVMAYIGAPMAPDEVEAGLARWMDHAAGFGLWSGRDGSGFAGVWFLIEDETDACAGEIGWRLPRRAWGRGYAVEGARVLVYHAFETLGVRRLRAETMAVNQRSRRVMEKLGMHHVGTYVGEWDDPIPGWEQGEVVYELTRDAVRSSGSADPIGSGRTARPARTRRTRRAPSPPAGPSPSRG